MNQFIDKRIRTYIVDNDCSFGAMCELLVNANRDFKVVGNETSLKSENSIINLHIDLLIIDVTNFSEEESKKLLTLKKGLRSDLLILALTYKVDNSVFDILKIGLVGFLNKSNPNFQYLFVSAIDKLLKDEITISHSISRLIVESFHQNPDCPLTSREREIILGASKGMTYSLISEDLNVSMETIKSHFKNIYTKLGVNSKYEAISMATSNSWV